MRFLSLLLAPAALAACQQSNDANAANVADNATAEASATQDAPGATATSCVASMNSEVDQDSFAGIGKPLSAQQFEALRTKADALFRDVANRMCAADELKPAELSAFKRLLIQNGAGADNTAIYSDPDTSGRDTLIFQYTFEGDALAVPDAADVREGLLCHFGDAEKYRELCEMRLP